ncbi:hypothetical protein FQN60_002347 [Etheostoma spectabile]|uniref:VWFD domain-containing protein n=1 Tax=Etheostoma spectabile TaxID=54343 RepID=A0A5J5DCC8_9PERO|nr:hypothetical protein FQN60_002347 [Etheostoma spectabile]
MALQFKLHREVCWSLRLLIAALHFTNNGDRDVTRTISGEAVRYPRLQLGCPPIFLRVSVDQPVVMANEWLLWLTLSAIIAAWHSEAKSAVNTFSSQISEKLTGVSPIHNDQVCSTWGNFHFKTFDGDVFQLHSTCNYVLTSSCRSSYKDFNIQIRRQGAGNNPTISNIIMKLEGSVVELSEGSVVVELDPKYKNQTCGLCGDFNGVQVYDEFYSHGVKISPMDFANFWKMDGPTESCSDYKLESTQSCNNMKPLCEQILTGPAFNSCHSLLDVASFTSACVADLCNCDNGMNEHVESLCLCNTVSEFSRQCGHAGTCSVEGGAHINTFDEKVYTFHGDCSYVLAKDCNGSQFEVQGELEQCGLTESETCLKSVTLGLSGGLNVIKIQSNGKVFVNGIYAQLPFSAAGISAFRGSSYYVLVQTSVGVLLEVQLQPVMQLYVKVTSGYQAKTCGLCGNFNGNQADDFLKLSGVPDATAPGFVNSWKTHAACPDVKSNFENPCSLSLDNEKYAQHWCSMLSDPQGVFASCHSEISPDSYKENCMYDSCNCEKSEDCMCSAVSSYVHACAAAGIQLPGWRATLCGKYASSCPSSMVYSYTITSSSRTCRCISTTDPSCHFSFPPIDGCVCAEGTYMDDTGKCVPSQACPCYHKGSVVPPGQVVNKDGVMCHIHNAVMEKVSGPGRPVVNQEDGGKEGKPGPKDRNSRGMTACAPPMVAFNCSANDPVARGTECEKSCNTLDMACMATGCVSGCMCPSGMVSDGKGGCIKPEACPCVHNGVSYPPGETTKDYCGSAQSNGTFRVVTENVPCGTTGTTCSKSIKIFLGNAELTLAEGSYQLILSRNEETAPFSYSTMGSYLVIEANNGLIFMWDRKTTLFIKLSPKYKGRVCGLCGNYDDNANNDFTTRSHAVVVNPLVFGNTWKDSPSCPDAHSLTSPCTANPYRQAWAQKQCSIIQSDVFSPCHSIVAIFCDYYNPPGECEWHYMPCGSPCMKTCRNPSGSCSPQMPPLEATHNYWHNHYTVYHSSSYNTFNSLNYCSNNNTFNYDIHYTFYYN